MEHVIKFTKESLPEQVDFSDYCPKWAVPLIGGVAYFKNPWKGEIIEIASKLDISIKRCISLQLNYELFGGGCTSSAISRNGKYDVLRILEWPLDQQILTGAEWQNLSNNACIKAVPGYTGLLTGKSGKVRVMMDMPENVFESLDVLGFPITWTLRKLVEDNNFQTLDEALDTLLSMRSPIIGGWVLLVSEDEAAWVELNPKGNHAILKRTSAKKGENLTIQNSYEYPEAEEDIIKKWFGNNNIEKLLKQPYISRKELPEGLLHLGCATDITVF